MIYDSTKHLYCFSGTLLGLREPFCFTKVLPSGKTLIFLKSNFTERRANINLGKKGGILREPLVPLNLIKYLVIIYEWQDIRKNDNIAKRLRLLRNTPRECMVVSTESTLED